MDRCLVLTGQSAQLAVRSGYSQAPLSYSAAVGLPSLSQSLPVIGSRPPGFGTQRAQPPPRFARAPQQVRRGAGAARPPTPRGGRGAGSGSISRTSASTLEWARPASASDGGLAVGEAAGDGAGSSARRLLSQALTVACSASAAAASAAADAEALEKAAASKGSGEDPATAASWRSASTVARAAARAAAEAARRAHARVASLRLEAERGNGVVAAAAARYGKAGAESLATPLRDVDEKTDTSAASSDSGSSEGDREADPPQSSLPISMAARVRGASAASRRGGGGLHSTSGVGGDSLGSTTGGRGASAGSSSVTGASGLLAAGTPARAAKAAAPPPPRAGGGGGVRNRTPPVEDGSSHVVTSADDALDDAEGSEPAPASLRALMRVRERRKAERVALADAEASAGASEETRVARAALAELKEDKAVERAQIYAVNRLLAAQQNALFHALVEERQGELEALRAVHAAEAEEQKQAGLSAVAQTQQRVKVRATELSREAEAREKEAGEGRRGGAREAAAREEERHATRSQIYAVNALLTERDAVAFHARFGVSPPDTVARPAAATKPKPGSSSSDTDSSALLKSPLKSHQTPARRALWAETVAALSPCKPSRKRDDDEGARSLLSSLLASSSGVSSSVFAAAQAAADAAAKRVLTVAAAHKEALSRKEVAITLKRESAREKGEEKEAFRAQVYALNKLMRAKEEANFAKFKAKVDAAAAAKAGAEPAAKAREVGGTGSSKAEAAAEEEEAGGARRDVDVAPMTIKKKKRTPSRTR